MFKQVGAAGENVGPVKIVMQRNSVMRVAILILKENNVFVVLSRATVIGEVANSISMEWHTVGPHLRQ